NRRIPGALIFGVGLTLNLIVILAFGGRMPVLLPRDTDPNSPILALLRGGLDPLHVALEHPQGLWFIGDIFNIPSIGGHSSLVSIGDLLIAAAGASLIVRWRPRVPSLTAPLALYGIIAAVLAAAVYSLAPIVTHDSSSLVAPGPAIASYFQDLADKDHVVSVLGIPIDLRQAYNDAVRNLPAL